MIINVKWRIKFGYFDKKYHVANMFDRILNRWLMTFWPWQAWEETFRNWENGTRSLVNYPKTKPEETLMIGDTIHRTVTKRRTSHQNTEHELEVRRHQWRPGAWISNYTNYKVLCEITYPFPNFNGTTVEVWEWISNFIPYFIGHVFTYRCWD